MLTDYNVVCILCDTGATYPGHLIVLDLVHYEAPNPPIIPDILVSTYPFPNTLTKGQQ
jgi:hypothetical protein